MTLKRLKEEIGQLKDEWGEQWDFSFTRNNMNMVKKANGNTACQLIKLRLPQQSR